MLIGAAAASTGATIAFRRTEECASASFTSNHLYIFGVRLECDHVWLPSPIRARRGQSGSACCSATAHPKLHFHHWYWSYCCSCNVIDRLSFIVSCLHLCHQHLQEHPEDQGKRRPEEKIDLWLLISISDPSLFFSTPGLRLGTPVGDSCHRGVGGLGWHVTLLPTEQHHGFMDPGLRHNLHHHVPSTRLCPVLQHLKRVRLHHGLGSWSFVESAERWAIDRVACHYPLPRLHSWGWHVRPAITY